MPPPPQPHSQPHAQAASQAAPSTPAAAPQPKPSATVLGKSVSIVGEIISQEDLTIDGDVKGSVEVRDSRLTIGPNGKLEASSLKAREVVVMGTVHGNVEALNKVFIRKDATLVGDVQTAGIVIEDGAYFKGGIDIQTRK
ncbi:MAG: bactofilin family protein [Bryobacteraceae bacterium]